MKKFLPWQRLSSSTLGFSILELSIVLVLCALLFVLSGTSFRFIDRMVVHSELAQLYTTCTYLQRYAMTHHKPQQLIFDLKNNRYRYHQTEHTLAARVQFGCPSYVKGPPSNPTQLIRLPISFKNEMITFHSDGIIEPGTVYLTDHTQRHIYALSCAVAQVSYLRKYRYTDRWTAM